MLWDCRKADGAVACLNRMAPVTVVKFVGKDHELLVAGEYGIAEIIDLRTHTSVTTLMKPSASSMLKRRRSRASGRAN